MKLSSLSIFVGLAVQFALAAPELKRQSSNALLINPAGFPDLPSPQTTNHRVGPTPQVSTGSTLDLDDVQGDILIGMRKNKETFFFFSIQDAATFKSKLSSDIKALVTSTNQILGTPPTTALNIAFSSRGLTALNVTDNLGDASFTSGQFANADSLGDPGTTNWVSQFTQKSIDGVLLLASNDVQNVDDQLANIQSILGDSISEVYRIDGAARPGNEQGHEHFGFLDGVSQPAVQGVQDPLPGQASVAPGVILVGTDGDGTTRPSWATGGSFLVFRQLQQKVPEFSKYVQDHALNVPGLTEEENADLFGARLIGRWKSGAPIDLAPLRDDPDLGANNQMNNNFTFAHPEVPGFDISTNQTFCPFSAHIRKTRPRADFGTEAANTHHIIRAGTPYGPEVTDEETASGKSSTDPSLERGLAFVAYQSDIPNGFEFMQEIWVDNFNFFKANTGVDPIIGRQQGSAADALRNITGTNPLDFTEVFTLDLDFVVSRGGEYFFSPPISALSGELAA
ncbi:dye-decolorizing heme-containing peroxidase [Stygiomarasmius scandens]|uniref:Dye-decolorizing heme-containing peroxidase n=1 Tax=Marasmiellus scandens TaxID=2682957 RepID=A0ABR1IQI3_9AGAR